jgi:hypothetical protein
MQSGTVVIVHDLDGFYSSDVEMGSAEVDLNSEGDYNDVRDRIKSVDAVTVAGWVGNQGDMPVEAEIWISNVEYTTKEEVRVHAHRIFVTPTIPARDTIEVTWTDGLAMVENIAELKSQILGDGRFFVYGMVNGDVDIWYELSLVVTVTVGI